MNLITSLLYSIPSIVSHLAQNKVQTPYQNTSSILLLNSHSFIKNQDLLLHMPCLSDLMSYHNPTFLLFLKHPSQFKAFLYLLHPMPKLLHPQIFMTAFSFTEFTSQLKYHRLWGVFSNYPASFSPHFPSPNIDFLMALRSGLNRWPLDGIHITCFLGPPAKEAGPPDYPKLT